MKRKYFTKTIRQISWPERKPYIMNAIYSCYELFGFRFFIRDELLEYSNLKHALMACKELELRTK